MSQTYAIVRGTAILLLAFGIAVWILSRWLKGSKDEPGVLIGKWIATVLLLAGSVAGEGVTGLLGGWFCGTILAILWTGNICSFLASPLGNLLDGGSDEAEPGPFYSIAQARQKQGNVTAAITEIQRQLEKYPHDYEGQMLLATLQAENLNDLSAAHNTIERLSQQAGHAPANVCFALLSLADWQLKYGQDPDSARRALERILELFPNSEQSLVAQQRLANLSSPDWLIRAHDRPLLSVPKGPAALGLHPGPTAPPEEENNPAANAQQWVKHLEDHPHDQHAREQLARVYAQEMGRIDLATAELEQLIAEPHQTNRQVAGWLTILAEMQLEIAQDPAAAHATWQRIIDRFPNSAAAEMARRHQTSIDLEATPKRKSQGVKLGSYEKDLGLKSKS